VERVSGESGDAYGGGGGTLCPKKNVHLFIFQITPSKINRF